MSTKHSYTRPTHYVEVYRDNGTQVLGTLDGQTSMRYRCPERTAHWRLVLRDRFAFGSIVLWRIVCAETGRIVASHRARMTAARPAASDRN